MQDGVLDATDNPLVNAPHTLADVASSSWEHPYSREQAAYPVESLRRYKYWAPVNRVDNVYGDRNLICACPAIDSYREESDPENALAPAFLPSLSPCPAGPQYPIG